MTFQDKIVLDYIEADITPVLGVSAEKATTYCFSYCANILLKTGTLSSRLFVLTAESMLIVDMGSMLHSDLGLAAAEDFIYEIGSEDAVQGMAIVHAIAQSETGAECNIAFADRADMLKDPMHYLIAHFEWKNGGRSGKRAHYQLKGGKVEFVSLEILEDPNQRYLFREGTQHEYIH
jgi:hypothetical protein